MENAEMEKFTIEDIARILVTKNSLSYEAATLFATQLFAVVQEGLNRDKIVKVKGLGTFKIVDVEARESINVNTGERVLIDSHGKISFTPDSTMKELVNKPFSQFETVVLKDGVTFDDMPADDEEDEDKDKDVEQTPQPKVETDLSKEPKQEGQSKKEQRQEAEQEEMKVSAAETSKEIGVTEKMEASQEQDSSVEEDTRSLEEVTSVEEQTASVEEGTPHEEEETPNEEEKTPLAEEDDEDTSTNDITKWIVVCIISLVLIALAACAGYIYGLNKGRAEARAFQSEQSAELPKPESQSPKPEPKSKDSLLAELHPEEPVVLEDEQKKADSINAAKAKTDEAKAEPKQEKKAEPKPEPKATASSDKYEKMDARVRTGAYRIVGVDRTVTVKKGETLKRISKTYLGEGMECYVEVLNGLNGNSELKEGSKLKIPKLELKKRSK